MHGKQTPESVVQAFLADYILTGNASASARKVGIATATGREIAAKANKDPAFGEKRRAYRAQELEDCIQARRQVREVSLKRFKRKWVGEPGEIDKRADYGKLVLECEKNAQTLARFEAERDGQVKPTSVSITVSGPANVDPKP